MPIKVIVNGAKGKMGKAITQGLALEKNVDLVGKTDLNDDLANEIKKTKAEVVVDFTHPDVRLKNVEIILSAKANAVVGTTGFTASDLEKVSELCLNNKKGCIVAPNFLWGQYCS